METSAQSPAEITRIAKRTSQRVLDMKKPGPVVVVKAAPEAAPKAKAKKAAAPKAKAPAKKAAAKKPAAKKAAPKAKATAKKVAAKKAARKPSAKASKKAGWAHAPTETADRSAAVAASWTNPKVAALRSARIHVKVHGVEYKSVHDAFVELGLPDNKHGIFRGALRASPTGKLAIEGHTFVIVK